MRWSLKLIEDTWEYISVEIKEIKPSWAEIKNAITEMQSQTDATTSSMDESDQRISYIEDKTMVNSEAEKKRETTAKEHTTRLRKLSGLLKRNSIQIIWVPENEEGEKGIEVLCDKIIAENFLKLRNNIDMNLRNTDLLDLI